MEYEAYEWSLSEWMGPLGGYLLNQLILHIEINRFHNKLAKKKEWTFKLLRALTDCTCVCFPNPISPRAGQTCPNPVQTRTPVKNQWVEYLNWSKTPCFHKGGPYEWYQCCLWALKCKEKTFFQTAISRELSDWGTKSGSQIEDFCENLILSPSLSKSIHPGVREKKKKLGDRSAPPWML